MSALSGLADRVAAVLGRGENRAAPVGGLVEAEHRAAPAWPSPQREETWWLLEQVRDVLRLGEAYRELVLCVVSWGEGCEHLAAVVALEMLDDARSRVRVILLQRRQTLDAVIAMARRSESGRRARVSIEPATVEEAEAVGRALPAARAVIVHGRKSGTFVRFAITSEAEAERLAGWLRECWEPA